MLQPEDRWADLPKTRKEAIEVKSVRYFTGKPCNKGHVAPRLASNWMCTKCTSAHAVSYKRERLKNDPKYRAKHNARVIADQKRRYAEDPVFRAKENARSVRKTTRQLQRDPKARSKNREKSSKWAKVNPGKANARASRHRAAKLRACPPWADREAILEFYEQAQFCTKLTGVKHQVDHIIPLQGKLVSGLHVANNLRVITATENMSKNNKLLPEFASG